MGAPPTGGRGFGEGGFKEEELWGGGTGEGEGLRGGGAPGKRGSGQGGAGRKGSWGEGLGEEGLQGERGSRREEGFWLGGRGPGGKGSGKEGWREGPQEGGAPGDIAAEGRWGVHLEKKPAVIVRKHDACFREAASVLLLDLCASQGPSLYKDKGREKSGGREDQRGMESPCSASRVGDVASCLSLPSRPRGRGGAGDAASRPPVLSAKPLSGRRTSGAGWTPGRALQ